LTPVMEQYHRIKSSYPDKILFFRMGDFYEMFGEDAIEAAKILNIALTTRSHGKDVEKIPLAGVPYHAAEKYINILLKAGKKVVICDQVEDAKLAKGLVKRAVVEIITPGTAITAEESTTGGYLVALHNGGHRWGLAAVEFVSGNFFVEEEEKEQIAERVKLLSPVEIIINSEFANDKDLMGNLALNRVSTTILEPHRFNLNYAHKVLEDYYSVQGIDGFGLGEYREAVIAAGVMLSYLRETKKRRMKHLNPPAPLRKPGEMLLDSATIRNLELLQPSIAGKGKSLLKTINYTSTPMGARLLARWISKPLTDIERIKERQSVSAYFLQDSRLSNQLMDNLKGMPDMERLIAKIGSNRVGPRDLGSLLVGIEKIGIIRSLKPENKTLADIIKEVPNLDDLAEMLDRALGDNLPAVYNNGGIFRLGYSKELDDLKDSISESKKWIAGLQNSERERTNIPNLKVGFNKVFGYYIEVSSSHLEKVPDNYIRKQTLVGGERFITEELKEREAEVLNAEEKINVLEKELFEKLIVSVSAYIGVLKKASEVISRLDVLRSFAELARKNNYIMPEVNNSEFVHIKDGRHPIIEQALAGRRFIANDLSIGGDDGIIHIITGPNMAGKSTYLRQIGHIVILAQIGCFVPAAEAKIGVVDRVFTRVGASDLLPEGKSTFLVEMNEVANILNNATNRSLVLLDEVGRGTSTYDGLSIAWAVSEYIHEKPNLRCKTLFATHYHELTDLANRMPGIRNFQVAVREWEEQIIFLHRIIPGGCDDSYGIQVAKLAGVPSEVIERAKEILQHLERGDMFNAKPRGEKTPKWMKKYASQLNLFGVEQDDLLQRIKNADPSVITPLEALQLLTDLINSLKSR